MTSQLTDAAESRSLVRPILISTLIVGVLDIGEVLHIFCVGLPTTLFWSARARRIEPRDVVAA